MASQSGLNNGSDDMHSLQNSGISQPPQSDMVMLATDFTPGDHDVICQRGKCCCWEIDSYGSRPKRMLTSTSLLLQAKIALSMLGTRDFENVLMIIFLCT
jgi:hypothetical protein